MNETKTVNNDTDVSQFIADLDGGVFEQKVGKALSEVAQGVTTHNKTGKAQGKVVIELSMTQIAGSSQVNVQHKLTMKTPTMNGDFSENDLTATPMHVGPGGKLALFPDWQVSKGQTSMLDRAGEPNKHENV